MKTRNLIISGLAFAGILAVRSAIRSARHESVYKRVVLITGGSRGLGLVLARQLAEEGARVVVCARNEEDLSKVARDFEMNDIFTVTCDITDKSQVKTMMEHIRSEVGEVDMLINNAGIVQVGPMETMTEEDYEAAMRIHFWGPYNLINEVLPTMKKRKSGRIVNIVSINGKITFPHLLPYTVSKYALSGFSEGITAELAKDGIRVTSVYPALIRTGSPINVDVKGQFKKEFAWFKVFDSLPFLSLNAEKAAQKIIQAMKAGDKTLMIGFTVKLAAAIHGIFPGLNLSVFSISNWLLPKPNGSGKESRKGFESKSWASSNFLTRKTEKAEVSNNER